MSKLSFSGEAEPATALESIRIGGRRGLLAVGWRQVATETGLLPKGRWPVQECRTGGAPHLRALIADDDRVTTTILSTTLQRWRVDAVVAHDGHSAWNVLCGTDGLALAIIDWMMPGIDGPELCRRIRHSASLEHMYVILLTGREGRADLVAGLDAGADDYIVKPFEHEELRARVHVGIRVAMLQERLAEQVAELQSARDALTQLANTDALTNLCSRRRWFELAAAELARYRRYLRPFAVLSLDLDLFKRVNDTFGHEAGDEVLKGFADVLRRQCRRSDVIGRLGGEEFALLLPEATIDAGQEVAHRIIESCHDLAIPIPAGTVTFSCSIGATEVSSSDGTVEDVLRRADAALYQAKRNGRDRVEGQPPVGVAASPDAAM